MEEYVKNTAKHIQLQPKKDTWDKIEERLDKKRKRKIGFILLGALGLSALGLLMYLNLSKTDELALGGETEKGTQETTLAPTSDLRGRDTKNLEVNMGVGDSLDKEPKMETSKSTTTMINEKELVKKGSVPTEKQKVTVQPENAKSTSDEEPKEIIVASNPPLPQMDSSVTPTSEQPIEKESKPIYDTLMAEVDTFRSEQNADTVVSGATWVEDTKMPDDKKALPFMLKPIPNNWAYHIYIGTGETFYRTSNPTDVPTNQFVPFSGPGTPPEIIMKPSLDKASRGYTIGVRAERNMSNRLWVGAGFNYKTYIWESQVGELKHRENINGKTYLVDSVAKDTFTGWTHIKNYLELQGQDEGYLYGDDQKLVSLMRYVSVPIHVRYDLYRSRRFHISAQAGLSPGLMTYARTTIFNSHVHSYLHTSQDHASIKRFALDMKLGLCLDYYITNRFGVSLEPVYSQQLTSYLGRSKNNIPYRPRATFTGMQVGLVFKTGKY